MTLRLVHPRPPRPPITRKPGDPVFTPEEEARIRAALQHARLLFGTWSCVTAAMGLRGGRLPRIACGVRRITADVAVRLARALGKPLETLYSAPASADRCPTCGARRST